MEQKIIEASEHMQVQISKYEDFLHLKKSVANFDKGENIPQFYKDDKDFEDAHNMMINKIMTFKNMLPQDKSAYLTQMREEFDAYDFKAVTAMNKINKSI